MNEKIIQVWNLQKNFGTGTNKNKVLDGITFDVTEGEFVSVMGPSGCGKSTLLYLIGGLDKPDCGSIHLLGKNIARISDRQKSILRRRDVGFIFQFYNLVPNLTVEENVFLPIIMDGRPLRRYKERYQNIMQVVGLEEKRKAYPMELSGGQQQRVAIARSLIMEPKILLADEPTGNLDRKSGQDIMRLFQMINSNLKVTILQVTHSDEIAAHGSRIIYLQDGKILRDTSVPGKA